MEEENPSSSSSSTNITLIIKKGPKEGESIEYKSNKLIKIGRVARGNTLQIKESGISSKHICIHFDNKWKLTDLDSLNGTFLNAQKLQPHVATALNDGDCIKIGELTSIIVKIGMVAEPVVELRRNTRRQVRFKPVVEEFSEIGLDDKLGETVVEEGVAKRNLHGRGKKGVDTKNVVESASFKRILRSSKKAEKVTEVPEFSKIQEETTDVVVAVEPKNTRGRKRKLLPVDVSEGTGLDEQKLAEDAPVAGRRTQRGEMAPAVEPDRHKWDLEKMTLGDFLDYIEEQLPKQIIDESEKIIADLEEKARQCYRHRQISKPLLRPSRDSVSYSSSDCSLYYRPTFTGGKGVTALCITDLLLGSDTRKSSIKRKTPDSEGQNNPISGRITRFRSSSEQTSGMSNIAAPRDTENMNFKISITKGKRDIKVKALEAAKAAKRREEEKENERKKKKESLKLELVRIRKENAIKIELNKKKKYEEQKKKEADAAARKRQRLEEEKKQVAKKRKLVAEAQKNQKLQYEKSSAGKPESEKQHGKNVVNAGKRKGADNMRQNKNTVKNSLQQKDSELRTDKSLASVVQQVASVSENRDASNDSGVKETVTSILEKSPVKVGHVNSTTQEISYDMSPYQSDDDDDDDEDDDQPTKKFIPSWCSKSRVAMVLPLQQKIDLVELFPLESFCSMDEVFSG